jgi:hypothetical protein
MRRRLFVVCTLIGLIASVSQFGLAQAQPSLVGSWQLTLVANGPPTPPAIPVAGLANFTSDGGAIATAAGILVGPVTSTTPTTPLNPAFGNWNDGGAIGHAVFKFVSLISNANGSLYATRTFQAVVTPSSDGSEFSGTYSFTVVDTNGDAIASGSGSIRGTLITHFLPPA